MFIKSFWARCSAVGREELEEAGRRGRQGVRRAIAREPEGDPDWLLVRLPALPGRVLAESALLHPRLTLLNFPDHRSSSRSSSSSEVTNTLC